MAATVIYKKKYPLFEDIGSFLAKTTDKCFSSTPIREKQEGSADFIRTAIGLSEQHKLDITILCHNNYVEAVISFDCGGSMGQLKELFACADDFSFFTDIFDRDVTISFYYHTHELVSKE